MLLALAVLIPLTAAVLMLGAGWGRRVPRVLNVLACAAHLAVGCLLFADVRADGLQVLRIGDWPAPWGIVLVADTLSAVLVVLTGFIGLCCAVASVAQVQANPERLGFHALFQMLMMGVTGAFLTGDLFNLFVWFEVTLISSFVLLCLGGERPQLEGGFKYVTLNLIASSLLLSGVGLLYGTTGTLNFADLHVKLPHAAEPWFATVVAMLFLTAFGVKAALFPLFFWLPASYHTPPTFVTALFAGLLTKLGVYAILRTFSLVFESSWPFIGGVLTVLAALTMVVGVFGAVVQSDFRRVLAFHTISQVGYIVAGIALMTPLGLAAALVFMVHHSVVKSALFLIAGAGGLRSGSFDLTKMAGLGKVAPGLAVAFAVAAMSLAGLPPFSGFTAKLGVVFAGADAKAWLLFGAALFTGLFTLLSMLKIGNAAFLTPGEVAPYELRARERWLAVPIAALVAATVALGLLAGPAFEVAHQAAAEITDPGAYVRAVLPQGGR